LGEDKEMFVKDYIKKLCTKCPHKSSCPILAYKDEPYHWHRLVDECPAVLAFIQTLIKTKSFQNLTTCPVCGGNLITYKLNVLTHALQHELEVKKCVKCERRWCIL